MFAWDYLQRLVTLPHRGSATTAEASAADLIAAEMQQLGYAVERQHFLAPRKTLYFGPPIVIGLFLAAHYVLGVTRPWLAALLMIVVSLPLIGELRGGRINLDVFLPRFLSQNVVARYRTTAEPEPPAVVVTAHYDTQWGSWFFSPAFRPFIQAFFTVAYGALLLLPVVTVAAALFPHAGWLRAFARINAVYLSLSALWLLINGLVGRYINGANDNGSGTALALALARHAAAGELAVPASQLMFVFTGSEETGTRGMIHFIRRFRRTFPAAEPAFVNLDNLGGGIPRYLVGEGMLGYTHYDPGMIAAAREVSVARGNRVLPQPNLLLPTDGVVAARAGYRALTFIAMDEKGRIPEYHWHTDVLENVDRSLLHYMEEYLVDYLKRLLTVTGRS